MSSQKLRDLIKTVRSCKTIAEERQIILNESSLIRTSIKEDDNNNRYNNISKLLYINILGYPTYYGQLECLKLISSNNFTDKRMGYLALTILLNEEAEILTLVTNSIKLDLNNFSNPYIQNLALISIGNLISRDMANDLIIDIIKFLTTSQTAPYTLTTSSYFSTNSSSFSSNYTLKKKACLVLIKLIQKDPSCIDGLENTLNNLIKENSNGLKVCLIQLIINIFQYSPEKCLAFNEVTLFIIKLSKLLSNTVKETSSTLYSNITNINYDPFLLVYCLNYLTNFLKYNKSLLEEISDLFLYVITTIATTLSLNTLTSSSNAVLYECIRGILAIDFEHSLKVLAINLLNKFLTNKDNNLRYISLNILLTVAIYDKNSIQKNRLTIIECLQDPDNSIRKRSLELLYQIVNENNVQSIVHELINFLKISFLSKRYSVNQTYSTTSSTTFSGTNEINIQSIANKIICMIEKYGQKLSIKWKIDSVINILTANNSLFDENISRMSIHFLSQANDFYLPYIVHKFYQVMKERTSYMSLIQTGIWCVGEYGHLLLNSYTFQDNTVANNNININSSASSNVSLTLSSGLNSIHFNSVPEIEIITFLERCLKLPYLDFTTKGIILNSIIKLSIRFNSSYSKSIERILRIYEVSMSLELQQRSNEYIALINKVSDSTRKEILERMPIPANLTLRLNHSTNTKNNSNSIFANNSNSDQVIFDDLVLTYSSISNSSSITTTSSDETSSNLLDLTILDTPTSTTNLITPSTSYDIYELLSLGSTVSSLTVSTPNDSILSGRTANSFTSMTSSTAVSSIGSSYHTINSGGSTPTSNTFDLLNMNLSTSNSVSSSNSTILTNLIDFDQTNRSPININENLLILSNLSSSSSSSNSISVVNNDFSAIRPSNPPPLSFPNTIESTSTSSMQNNISSSPYYFTKKIPSRIFQNNSFYVDMDYEKSDPNNSSITKIRFNFSNSVDIPIENFNFQVAVPKYLSLEIFPASSLTIPPNSTNQVHQEIQLINSKQGTKKITLRLRITFKIGMITSEEICQVNSFPVNY